MGPVDFNGESDTIVAQEWYVKIGDEARGPVGGARLKEYAAQGRLKPEMQVRRGEQGPWVPAAKVKGLFPAPPPPERVEEDIFADVPLEPSPVPAPPPAPPAPEDQQVPSPAPAPVEDPIQDLPSFEQEPVEQEPEEEVSLDALPTPNDPPEIDVIPQIVVEPKPLVPVKKAKFTRKGKKSRRGEPEPEEPSPPNRTKEKGKRKRPVASKEKQPAKEQRPAKGKRRGKSSTWGIQQVLGAAAALAIVVLSAALAYVLWPAGEEKPQQSATQVTNPVTQQVSARTEPLSRAELFKSTAPAVAFIKGRMSSGTGWLIAPNLLATNRHVIEGELMRHIEVHFPSAPEKRQGPYKAKVVYIDIGVDLAFLEVETSTPALPRASQVEFVPGADITVIGCPGIGPDLTIKNGIFPGTLSSEVKIDGREYDQLSISVNPGNSGGPVFDEYGQVIGVVTLKAAEQEGIGFSIPMREVDRLLERAQKLSRDQIGKARAVHRARVVITHLEESGSMYKSGMEGYLKALQEAKQAGRPTASVEGPREFIKERMAKIDELLTGDLEQEFAEIAKDEMLEEVHRKDITELVDVYREMKKCIEEPSDDTDAFAEKCKDLSQRYGEVVKRLAGLKGK